MLDRPSHQHGQSSAATLAPLLMLPGTLCDARIFAPVLALLDQRATVPGLAGADSAAAMARAILALAPDTMSLCGFSLGAIVALEIVTQAPERVERLALIGCNPGVLTDAEAAHRASLTQESFLAGETGRHRALLEAMAADTPPLAFAQQSAMTLSRRDSRPLLDTIAVPTLVLCGANDRTCPPAMSRAIAAAIPNAHLAIIEGAGHHVTLDQPASFARELAAWLHRPATTSLN